jgi:acetyltransferase-like isoleucine patch superfamily enzyme
MIALVRTWLRYLKRHGLALSVVGVIEFVLNERYYAYLREEYYKQEIRETAKAVGDDLWVGGKASVNSNTVLGDNVHFNGMRIRGSGAVTIGDNFHCGSGCTILTENHNYDHGDAIPYDDTFVRKEVVIEDNVWLGIDVLIIPGVTIDEGAIVQSGSVVTKDIPPGGIAGGHPAEVFDERDMDHYRALKSSEKFN